MVPLSHAELDCRRLSPERVFRMIVRCSFSASKLSTIPSSIPSIFSMTQSLDLSDVLSPE
jgi:hypothetical protein